MYSSQVSIIEQLQYSQTDKNIISGKKSFVSILIFNVWECILRVFEAAQFIDVVTCFFLNSLKWNITKVWKSLSIFVYDNYIIHPFCLEEPIESIIQYWKLNPFLFFSQKDKCK